MLAFEEVLRINSKEEKSTRFISFKKIPLFQRSYENDSVACINVQRIQPEKNLKVLKKVVKLLTCK
jgi:hypothetical protein